MQIPIPEADFFQHPKRLFYGLLVAVFTITTAYSQPPPDDSEKIKPLFVMISAYSTEAQIDNIGAGLIFGATHNRLYIVTAEHVVRPKVDRRIVEADSIMVQFRSLPGEKFKAVLQPDSDKILDLAVLRIEDWGDQGIDAGGVPFDRLGVPDKLKRGADVFHVGNPMGQSWRTNVKPDKISENIGNFLSFESNFITTGHSGGGLFNECWDLVGMIIEDLPPDGKATRIDKIVETLQQWGYPIDLRTDSSRLPCPSDGGNGPTTSNAIGFSLGASSSIANSSDIYIGNESGLYLEGYLKYKLMDIGKRGGYLGIEPSVGVDFREAIPKWLFRGTTAANGFVNLFAGWQGEQTPIQANVGIGVGAVGIFYNYHASDGISDSLGKNYNENRMKLASNLFLEIGFPLPKNLKFRGLLRYIYASGKVDDLPEMKYVDGEDGLIEPQGQITGWYFAGGLEFPFR